MENSPQQDVPLVSNSGATLGGVPQKARRTSRVMAPTQDQIGTKSRRMSRVSLPPDPLQGGTEPGAGEDGGPKPRRKSRVDRPEKAAIIEPPKKPEPTRPAEQVHYEFSYSKAVYDYVKAHRKGRRRVSRLAPLPEARPGHPAAASPTFAQGVVLHHVHKIGLFGIPDDGTFIWEASEAPNYGFSPRLHMYGEKPQDAGKNKRQRPWWAKDKKKRDASLEKGQTESVSNTEVFYPAARRLSTDAGFRRSSSDRKAENEDRNRKLHDEDRRRSSNNSEVDAWVRRSSIYTNDSVDAVESPSKTRRSPSKDVSVFLLEGMEYRSKGAEFTASDGTETVGPRVTFAMSPGEGKRRESISCPALPVASQSPLPPALSRRRRYRKSKKKDVGFSLPALQCARPPAPRACLASFLSDKDERDDSSVYGRRKQSKVSKLPSLSS